MMQDLEIKSEDTKLKLITIFSIRMKIEEP